MAKYRQVHTKLWNDKDWGQYNMAQRMVFFYLWSNPSTTESGVYEVPIHVIAGHCSLSDQEVEDCMNHLKNVSYDRENGVVFVHNFLKHNGRGNPQLLARSVAKDMRLIHTDLWGKFCEIYPEYILKLLDYEDSPILEQVLSKYCPSLVKDFNRDRDRDRDRNRNRKGAPIKDMFRLYSEQRRVRHSDHWEPKPQDGKLAIKIWKLCVKDEPDDPLGYYERKLKRMWKHWDLFSFGGVYTFWQQVDMGKETSWTGQ